MCKFYELFERKVEIFNAALIKVNLTSKITIIISVNYVCIDWEWVWGTK